MDSMLIEEYPFQKGVIMRQQTLIIGLQIQQQMLIIGLQIK